MGRAVCHMERNSSCNRPETDCCYVSVFCLVPDCHAAAPSAFDPTTWLSCIRQPLLTSYISSRSSKVACREGHFLVPSPGVFYCCF